MAAFTHTNPHRHTFLHKGKHIHTRTHLDINPCKAVASAAGSRDADCDAGSVVSSAQEVEVMSAPQNVLVLGIQKTLRKWRKTGWMAIGWLVASGRRLVMVMGCYEPCPWHGNAVAPFFSMGVTAASKGYSASPLSLSMQSIHCTILCTLENADALHIYHCWQTVLVAKVAKITRN